MISYNLNCCFFPLCESILVIKFLSFLLCLVLTLIIIFIQTYVCMQTFWARGGFFSWWGLGLSEFNWVSCLRLRPEFLWAAQTPPLNDDQALRNNIKVYSLFDLWKINNAALPATSFHYFNDGLVGHMQPLHFNVPILHEIFRNYSNPQAENSLHLSSSPATRLCNLKLCE